LKLIDPSQIETSKLANKHTSKLAVTSKILRYQKNIDSDHARNDGCFANLVAVATV